MKKQKNTFRVYIVSMFLLLGFFQKTLAQDCYGVTANAITVSQSGGPGSSTLQNTGSCSLSSFSLGTTTSWLTTSISSTGFITVNAQANTGHNREGSIPIYYNGNISGGFSVIQNGSLGTPGGGGGTTNCTIGGFGGDGSFNGNGETRTYTLTRPSGCAAIPYFTFGTHATAGTLPSWISISQPAYNKVTVTFTTNNTGSPRSVIIIGTNSGEGAGIGMSFSQLCLQKTWYPDADDDGFRDPTGASQQGCASPSGNWTLNTTIDACPDSFSTTNNGCPPNCANVSIYDSLFTISEEGGIKSTSMTFNECSGSITFEYNPLATWFSIIGTGSQITVNFDLNSSTDSRYESVNMMVNGLFAATITVAQGGQPSGGGGGGGNTSCTVAGFQGGDYNGEKQVLTFPLTYSNCTSTPNIVFTSMDPQPNDWFSVSKSGNTVTVVLEENTTGYGRSVIIIGEDQSQNLSVGGQFYQDSCPLWYLDSDKDGFGDVYGVGKRQCEDPDNDPNDDPNDEWVNNNSDLCPYDPGLANNSGCPAGVTPPENWNTVSTKAYDLNQVLKASSKAYFNDLGKPVQSQSWDVKSNKKWASQSLYDSQGRPAFSTLSSPIGIGNAFVYKNEFIKTETNGVYGKANFENDVDNPTKVGAASNTLGWYYSNSNTNEELQDVTDYPFSRTVYSELRPGAVKKVLGGNKINEAWQQGYTFSMRASQELAATVAFGETKYNAYKIIKTVSRDVRGIENVVFTDTDGKTLAAARSGDEGVSSSKMTLPIGEQGYVDIHIPKGITGFTVTGTSAVTVYNLITETVDTTAPSSLGNGFYRIAITDLDAYTADTNAVEYYVNYYDYSLNEYNEIGQLITSYQPIGNTKASKISSSFIYNTLGQLVETTSPDEGTAKFKYRNDGQIRFSQNIKQQLASPAEFSYTNYDNLGRPEESGVLESALFDTADPDGNLPSGTTKEVQETTYDIIGDAELLSLPTAYQNPSFLAGNVAKTHNNQTTTYYSYDVYGRVQWIVQDIASLGGFKTIDYTYDPITSQVTLVEFQKQVPAEYFAHVYTYDTVSNELQKVETRTVANGIRTLHATYEYYETGALKRKILGTNLQGIDYVYNLAGQLKSINHPDLTAANDPGGDANDAFGMQIDYHSADYLRANTKGISATTYGTDQLNGNIKGIRWNSEIGQNSAGQNSYEYTYNRNNWLTDAVYGVYNTVSNTAIDPIVPSSAVVNSGQSLHLKATASIILGDGFHAKTGSTFTGIIVSANGFIKNSKDDYKVSGITYDANGNIKKLNRNKHTENGTNAMDVLTYEYDEANNKPNQLKQVVDDAGQVGANDIGDQNANNYHYNSIGQLIENHENVDPNDSNDLDDIIRYTYNASGLVTEVSRKNVSLVKFYYNDKGYRVKKEAFNTSTGALQTTTVYVRDAAGTPLAIYINGALEEHTIYGAGRLGVYNRTDYTSTYELTDHLGNVRALVQEGNTSFGANDYYPFGMLMPGRNSANGYRYAFQGQEKDIETGQEAFQLRLWDSRIGRWLTTDPAGQYASPYLGMGNNPISLADSDGGYAESPDNKYKGVWNKETQQYDMQFVDNTGGEFYDVVNYEGGVLNGMTDFFVNPYIKGTTVGGFLGMGGEEMLFLDSQVKRQGVGEWGYDFSSSGAVTPISAANYLPLPPIFKGLGILKGVIGKGAANIGAKLGFRALKDVGHKSLASGIISRVGGDLGNKYFSGFLIKNKVLVLRFQFHKHSLNGLKGVVPGTKVPHINFNNYHLLLGKVRNNGSRWFKGSN